MCAGCEIEFPRFGGLRLGLGAGWHCSSQLVLSQVALYTDRLAPPATGAGWTKPSPCNSESRWLRPTLTLSMQHRSISLVRTLLCRSTDRTHGCVRNISCLRGADRCFLARPADMRTWESDSRFNIECLTSYPFIAELFLNMMTEYVGKKITVCDYDLWDCLLTARDGLVLRSG